MTKMKLRVIVDPRTKSMKEQWDRLSKEISKRASKLNTSIGRPEIQYSPTDSIDVPRNEGDIDVSM